METNAWYWIGFNAFVLIMLALDLGVFHKKTHEVKVKEALIWTAVWIALAMVFNAGIFHFFGKEKGVEFLTGYVIEKSLSVDNIFVFIMVFSYFQIPTKYQHKVLFWGVLGALVMRAIFIFAGVALISKFHWIIYIFGGFLIFTGFKMLFQEDKPIEPEKNPLIKLVRKILPVSNELHGDKFIIKQGAKTIATPLLLVLVLI
ncbi:MAG TPA: TerC/Alx family metal homeostasis membrane protein, partial [Chitinophagales bacterium]|nr:TerC/Alx family metal homeostasis membrane protein [Chitinophagales bacterium]